MSPSDLFWITLLNKPSYTSHYPTPGESQVVGRDIEKAIIVSEDAKLMEEKFPLWWLVVYQFGQDWVRNDSFDSPEPDLLQVEGILYYSCGGDPHPQNILLGGKIVWQSYPVYVSQVTEIEIF